MVAVMAVVVVVMWKVGVGGRSGRYIGSRWMVFIIRFSCGRGRNRVYNMRLYSYQASGRPRKTRVRGVQETLTTHGIRPARAFHLAVDRELSSHNALDGASRDQRSLVQVDG